MRTVVVSKIPVTDIGVQQIEFWFRVAIPNDATRPGRQAYYASQQSTYQPQAPVNNDATKQAAEVQALQAGQYTERYGGIERVDPNMTAALLRTRLQNLLADEAAKLLAHDDIMLSRYGTAFDDSSNTWAAGSA